MRLVNRLANLRWVAAALSPLMVILMETFWVYPWLFWLGRQMPAEQRPPLSLASLILLMGASFLVTRFFTGKKWQLRWIQLAIVSSGLVAIFLVVRIEYGAGFGLLSGQWFIHITQALLDSFLYPHPVVIALVAGVYLWWRGISWGRSPLSFDAIHRPFLVGLIALVVLIIVSGMSSGVGTLENLLTASGLYIAGFFFFGLSALALGHLRTIHEKMLKKEGVSRLFSRRWLFILLGVIGGIVLVGIGIASIFSYDLVTLMAQGLNSVADFLLQVLSYLLIPIGYLVAGLVYVFRFLINLLGQGEPLPPFQPPQLIGESGEAASQSFPPEVILVIKWAFFAIVAAGVIFLLTKAIFRYWSSRAKDEIEETHESLWNWDLFKADLRLFLNMLLQRFKRKRKQPVPVSPVPAWYSEEEIPDRLDIREVYRHLLWEAARLGMARSRHETAYEYAERLGQAVPPSGGQLAQLTELYSNVRYGEIKPQDKQVERANRLWRVLRRLLRGLRDSRQSL